LGDREGSITVTHHPTGRTEVLFPDGHRKPNLAALGGKPVHRLCIILPELRQALAWAGCW